MSHVLIFSRLTRVTRYGLAALTVGLWSSGTIAQIPPRDVLMQQFALSYTQSAFFSPDSPFIQQLLAPAKSKNPGVSNDTWSAAKQDVAVAVAKVMTEKGGLMDSAMRKSVETLSDVELQKLTSIFGDPAFKKFQAAIASPSTQQLMGQALVINTMKMTDAINKVLTSRGLTEIH